MKSRLARIGLVALLIHVAATAAWAFDVGPFSFGFATPALNNWFLFPFRISGCA
jgi:hypothetical protein